jgi:hypothetical protein
VARLRKEGDGGILHRLRGRASKRKLPQAVREEAVKLVKREYADFGPTLAAEYLAKEHRLRVSKETLRQWLMEAGVWKRKRRRVEAVHVWRARRPCRGELVQWDTSEHDWLEGRGPKLFLLAMVDDASSRALARFAERDATEANLRLLGTYLERWGRPGEFYADKDSMLTVNQPVRQTEDEAWEAALIPQCGTAGAGDRLDSRALVPQGGAKGRIERFFGTLQDRLVKGMRQAGVRTLAAANAYWEQKYWPLWNRRFTVEPANATDAHRPLRGKHDLAAILSHVEEWVVANDYTIRYDKKIYQIARADLRPGLRGATVRVEERGDRSVWVRFRDRYLRVKGCEPLARPQPQPAREPVRKIPRVSARPQARRWMEGFSLNNSPPLWKVLQHEAGDVGPQEAAR